MPSTKHARSAPKVSSPSEQAITSALNAVDTAASACSAIASLRSVLKAIYKLSTNDEVVHGLAGVGVALAGDLHEFFETDHEDFEKTLANLRGQA